MYLEAPPKQDHALRFTARFTEFTYENECKLLRQLSAVFDKQHASVCYTCTYHFDKRVQKNNI